MPSGGGHIINAVKLVPYAWLGLFDARNLATSLVLAPLAAWRAQPMWQ